VTHLSIDFKIPRIEAPVAKHKLLTCSVKFSGFMDDHLDTVAYFARYSAHQMGLPCTPTIHLEPKLERWTVNKSPFVHARAKEAFERRTYQRVIQIHDGNLSVVNEWIDYVNSKLPAGVKMNIRTYDWQPIAFAKESTPETTTLDASIVQKPTDGYTFDAKVRARAAEIIDQLKAELAKTEK
jgi:small subunit ribosomal protein S10